MDSYRFDVFSSGRVRQVRLTRADDLAHLGELDRKRWMIVSLPVADVRFDSRTLMLMDTDHDGRIRFDEILGAIDFLRAHGVDLAEVFDPPKDLEDRLAAVRAKGADGEDEERTILYRLHLLELLENFVNLRRLYDPSERAIFQTGTLWIDARELTLCCEVADAAAHAELAAHSLCCLLYVKLSRPSEGATREICAAVTAGRVGSLYAGRNGVFCDRDGRIWEATVTKVVENQVSLVEAFWAPWKKIGESVAEMLVKALGDRQVAAQSAMKSVAQPGTQAAGGAALASSVAAIGIGIGMVGAAAASLMAAVSRLTVWQLAGSVLAIFAIVSLPSVILTWFKLRRRDLGAILNAGGWAVNRPLRLSMRLAKTFTLRARS